MASNTSPRGIALFATAVGRCGIAWNERGVVAIQLPAADARRTRERLLRRCPGARDASPPPDVRRAIDGIVGLLGGEATDLSTIVLDMDAVPQFHRRVYEMARTVPCGATLTYGEIAARLGEPGAAREVGQALGQNPFAVVVPCHRVVAAGGKLGGFSANGGADTKLRLLRLEGAPVNGTLPLFDDLTASPR